MDKKRRSYLKKKGAELSDLRKSKGISVVFMSKKLDVSRTVLSSIFNGNQDYVSNELLEKIEAYLKGVKS